MLVWLPVDMLNTRTVSIITATGFTKTRSEVIEKRVWAVADGSVTDDTVDYRDYDYSKVDVICFGHDKHPVEPYIRPGEDRVTIHGFPWGIYVDQAMAIILEHIRNTDGNTTQTG